MKRLRKQILLLLGVAAGMAPAWAARDFTPLAGTWVIDAELDGKPGRGLAIDVQGNTVVLQVYGYEANGAATFYMASGQMDGDSAVLPLQKFKGGVALGGAMQDAVLAENVGNVRLQFANGVQGSIQLPGEPAYAMRRFIFNPRGEQSVSRRQRFALAELDAERRPVGLWNLEVYGSGRLILKGQAPSAYWYFVCQPADEHSTVECSGEAPAETPKKKARLSYQQHLYDLSALMEVEGEPARRMVGAYQDTATPRLMPSSADQIWFSGFQGGYGGQRIPEPGTWIVRDEKTGKPGRGFSLDVQFDQALLQIFNYRPDGSATFHMGLGEYAKSKAQIALKTYQGGRYLGGPWQSATEASDAGLTTVNFDRIDSYKNMNEGSIRLPQEPLRVIERFELQPTRPDLASLMGDWIFTDRDSEFSVVLNRINGKVLSNEAGDFQCQFIELLTDTVVECNSVAATDKRAVRFSFPFSYRGRSVASGGIAFRVRDSFGNLTGVGPLIKQ
ncbi:hypothetical protein [Comamonas odontotermitis]|uniref:hypothetical protein n=1 Tax=Comamonas odontotermitis TaxID=379895 RepID=UPI0037515FB8